MYINLTGIEGILNMKKSVENSPFSQEIIENPYLSLPSLAHTKRICGKEYWDSTESSPDLDDLEQWRLRCWNCL